MFVSQKYKKIPKKVCRFRKKMYLCNPNAEIAQLVEHDLAKVGVASSSLVFRSKRLAAMWGVFVCGQVTVGP